MELRAPSVRPAETSCSLHLCLSGKRTADIPYPWVGLVRPAAGGDVCKTRRTFGQAQELPENRLDDRRTLNDPARTALSCRGLRYDHHRLREKYVLVGERSSRSA